MTNFQVYKKVLSFSLLQFVVDLTVLILIAGLAVGGFFIFDNTASSKAIIGMIVGLVIGIIIAVVVSYLVSNRIKAAQIAMMTKGVTEGELPENTFKEGFNELKGRFAKITLLFVVMNAIKGIFRQIGRGISNIGQAVGGDVGGGIGSAIDSAIQTLIGYLCDCCLGWVLFRKDENSAKAACEGAVIFFKHGKTLIRNVGRIFGMGFLSLLLIGGAFFGASYAIFNATPALNPLVKEIADAITNSGSEVPAFFQTSTGVIIIVSALIGLIMWSILHSVLIRPFILTGVLRNFMEAGKEHLPTEADFKELDAKYPRFAKLHNKTI